MYANIHDLTCLPILAYVMKLWSSTAFKIDIFKRPTEKYSNIKTATLAIFISSFKYRLDSHILMNPTYIKEVVQIW